MTIAVVGLNHKTSGVELRESVSFTPSQAKDFIRIARELYPCYELVILSTCNRVEVYIGTEEGKIDVDIFISLLTSHHNISKEELLPFIYSYTDDRAIEHLFEVATGIDSLVIGETQILGQVKASYQRAFELDATAKALNTVFQRAFSVAKKVRQLTRIGEGNVSISSVACQMAEEVLEGLLKRKVLLIGTGKVGRLTLKSLHDKMADTVLISSRTYEKAETLAKEFNGRAVRLDQIEGFLVQADIVISSTSAPHYILHPDMLRRVINRRGNRPIFLIDLAVPRDIDPVIGRMGYVYLYNIDSLKRIAEQNIKQRENEVIQCRRIISRQVADFIKQRNYNLIGKEDDTLLETIAS